MTTGERSLSEVGSALAPLRERYAHWLALSSDEVERDREEAAADIRAMQLVLRMERQDPPSWHRAMRAAVTGAASICLDPRSQPGGEWFDAVQAYCVGHIRKVTRRARGAHWVAAQDPPGVTVEIAGTQVRVLLPGLVSELDPRISRLQVGGTDVPVDPEPAPDAEPASDLETDPPNLDERGLRVWTPTEPVMTLGKAMAQAGHAGMIAAALLADSDQDALRRWAADGCPAVVRRSAPESWAGLLAAVADERRGWASERLLAVRDAGFTEIAAGTVTAIAAAPRM